MSEKHVLIKDLVIPPCREKCPAGVDIARYIRCIKNGNFDEALAVVRERIPFPAICGFACYAPCEAGCGNKQFGDPIAIRALKRTAAEKGGDLWRQNLKKSPDTGKRIAIVGAGPSGLTVAYYLVTLGYQVTVFEALEKAGGMMRVGIPAYRLPRDILDKEIDYLKDIGVEIKTGYRINSIDQLWQEKYDSVYIACGAHQGMRLGIPGDELNQMLDGISFLADINSGQSVDIGARVAVIGGGNTALDSARCAVRLGAKDVIVFYRRSKAEMPANNEEIEATALEGVKFEFLTTPTQASATTGTLEMTFVKMKLGKPDESGRPSPIPIKDSHYIREFDTVIAAIGQVPVETQSLGIGLNKWDYIQVDTETLLTDKPGVFAGGDVVTGPGSIIDAIAQGRKAASSIDRFLGGTGSIDQILASPEEKVVIDNVESIAPRQSIPCISAPGRTAGFDLVELGFNETSAIEEANRCRSCDARKFEVTLYAEACKECGYCAEVCGLDVFEPADTFNEKGYRPMMVQHQERCVGCGLCYYACPDFSIDVKKIA